MLQLQRIVRDLPERQHNGKPLAALILAGLLVPGPGSAGEHVYSVAIDAALARMTVEARFASRVGRISARSRDARKYLDTARDCAANRPLYPQGRRLVMATGPLYCLRYSVDLAAAARGGRLGSRSGPDTIAVSPSLWLWRPRLDADDRLRVRFELPDGIEVAVPWRPVAGTDGEFTFGRSPRSGNATAVFGRFASARRSLGDTDIRITVLPAGRDIDIEALADWVRDAAGNVALAYGRFPNPAIKVFLVPVGGNSRGGGSAVPFGRVVRDGGESVELLIDATRPLDEFYGEWAPTHEFAHLLLPYLDHGQRWISEGFATYYQNLLLARAGRYSEETGWRKLVEGFGRGRESVPSLSPNAAAADGERSTRMKIYWSGAALALIADVELRRRSAGRESLDTVLDRLQRCCLPSARTWSGPELFAQLDRFVAEPLFVPLYERYADSAGFPSVTPLLTELGVITDAGDLRFSESARLAPLRRALMAPPARPES